MPEIKPSMISTAIEPYSGRSTATSRNSHRSASPRMMPGTVNGSQEMTSSAWRAR